MKAWCDSNGHRSVYSAKTAWLTEEKEAGRTGQCFFALSELGKVMGGCFKKERCHFASSHG